MAPQYRDVQLEPIMSCNLTFTSGHSGQNLPRRTCSGSSLL